MDIKQILDSVSQLAECAAIMRRHFEWGWAVYELDEGIVDFCATKSRAEESVASMDGDDDESDQYEVYPVIFPTCADETVKGVKISEAEIEILGVHPAVAQRDYLATLAKGWAQG